MAFPLGEILLNLELEYDTEPKRTIADRAENVSTLARLRQLSNHMCSTRESASLTRPSNCRDEELPAEIAENLNGWLYGCDICQMFARGTVEKPTDVPAFEPRLARHRWICRRSRRWN